LHVSKVAELFSVASRPKRDIYFFLAYDRRGRCDNVQAELTGKLHPLHPEAADLWRGLVRVTPAPGFGDGASPQQHWLRG